MSKFLKVALIATLAVFLVPAVASADPDSLHLVTSGGTVNGSGTTLGTTTPSILQVIGIVGDPSSNIGGLGVNFGSLTFETGTWNGSAFDPGGFLTIISGPDLVAYGIAEGTVLFSGVFSSETTWSCVSTTCGLFGLISGVVNNALMGLVGLEGWYVEGAIVTLVINFTSSGGTIVSADISLTPVPEPGTLALFGTGLLSLAGVIRRKRAAAAK